jgi:hypothetical protein
MGYFWSVLYSTNPVRGIQPSGPLQNGPQRRYMWGNAVYYNVHVYVIVILVLRSAKFINPESGNIIRQLIFGGLFT